ncbi:hypothetical protein CQ010_01315 [Arthrobacter sp. MYb211]|uniref:hypothetical protein n=1 Tax=unclassified Arthrobacter TaxID=235627 RepID=UPI000CFC64C0|nr:MULTISPECIES: hypothetical protein [unclassified Arthrobacter]PRA13313.1 hypothetical protein CQ015_03570 [Arthrobacter sp. MYb221]PRC10510.1 hypothetical protein CQ010_01315 [Arthrobacter sp. MYb211]
MNLQELEARLIRTDDTNMDLIRELRHRWLVDDTRNHRRKLTIFRHPLNPYDHRQIHTYLRDSGVPDHADIEHGHTFMYTTVQADWSEAL